MKIQMIQNCSSINFTGFLKKPKNFPVNIMENPTEEVLKESEARWQKQIEDLGLVVIKKVKLFVSQKFEAPVKGVKKENDF